MITGRAVGRSPLTRALAIACVLMLAFALAGWWLFGSNQRRITAYFASGVGIYSGGDVRMLGVPIGRIDEIVPQGQIVRVTMSVNRDVQIPADAGAVEVTPSVVSDRYVQLTPPYKGGPTMRDGAVIPKERTVTPVELDDIYRSLNQLTTALGPNGANANGALSQLLNTGAANLGGNGQELSDTLQHLGQLDTTLAGNSKDLFATIDNLQKFTSMLAANDGQVRQFNTQMQQVNGFLASERQDMAAALANLAVALGKVDSFIRDNRAHIKSNVDQLNAVAQVLVKEKAALSEGLTDGPLALSNLSEAYNAASGTLDTRSDINELNQPPLIAVCKLIQSTNQPNLPLDLTNTCNQLAPVINGTVPLPTPAQTFNSLQRGTLPPLPLPLTPNMTGQSGGGQ
jgi:phospholipid/cholesterol/gamma-HCH transport system substrate-binding protein